MAKDSFIIYKSFYEPIKSLSDKQLGRLFRALFDYQIEGSTQVDVDLQMAFAFFKNQMDIDESKYQKVVERNKQNGSKGGRPPKEENPKNPVGLNKPKKAYNDNDNGNDNDNDNELPHDIQKQIHQNTENELASTFKELAKDVQWLEVIAMNNRLKSTQAVINLLEEFYRDLQNRGEEKKSISDSKHHFANWLKKKV